MERRQPSVSVSIEQGSAAADAFIHRRAVQVSVSGLDERRVGVGSVRAAWLGAKAVQNRQGAARCDSENRAISVGPTPDCRPVEVLVRGLYQCRVGLLTVT